MTCEEMDRSNLAGGEIPEVAREHLLNCPKCRALAAAFAAEAPPLPPGVLDHIRPVVLSSVKRVRPLAPAGVFLAAILVVFAAIATVGGKYFGMYGIRALTPVGRVAIFGVLIALALLAAWVAARDMRPGARSMRGGLLFVLAIVAVETVFLTLFHDYRPGRFLRWGMGCLRAGLACTIPAAILVWLLVRRGYIVSPVSTGAAIGVVAGLTGLTALELHCPIFSVPHVAVWHAAVLVVSVATGAVVGWLARRIRR